MRPVVVLLPPVCLSLWLGMVPLAMLMCSLIGAAVLPAAPSVWAEPRLPLLGLAAGLAIGGVRHEFRDEPGGFHARLCVEFPLLTVPHLLDQHRWHLACEFSNWIEAALQT